MFRFQPFILVAALVAGCATQPRHDHVPATAVSPGLTQLSPFSSHAGGGLPRGWEPLVVLRDKKPTAYQLVSDEPGLVLHAHADLASSALMHHVDVEPAERPWLQWQWKIHPAARRGGASPGERGSPARIVLGFDGDKGALPFTDQILFETAKVITGHDFPYATLMYVWAENLPVGTIVPSRHSSRIRMVVAGSGLDGLGSWRRYTRNIVEDFERAFGEKPGRLIGVGVLTDDEAEDGVTDAWYGDIKLTADQQTSETLTGKSK